MNSILGGRTVVKTYPDGNPEYGITDKEFYEDGCDPPTK